ncbi:MAG: Extracellular exo-alpha-L-arabinofuranosidase, partial [Phycisphaerales bacterium]|nr:Extracellular exo-alpha-L-arabinofuranosidase [Phycisphaerales bacterium]
QVMNPGDANTPARIHLEGFTPASPAVRVTEISGNLNDTNTADMPRRVAPSEHAWNAQFKNGEANYTFPPRSFTILRLE